MSEEGTESTDNPCFKRISHELRIMNCFEFILIVAVFPLFYGLKLSAPGAEFQCSGNIKIDSEYSEQTRERTESASGNWNWGKDHLMYNLVKLYSTFLLTYDNIMPHVT